MEIAETGKTHGDVRGQVVEDAGLNDDMLPPDHRAGHCQGHEERTEHRQLSVGNTTSSDNTININR